MRDGEEITHGFGCATAPEGVRVYNPAFDVTPHALVTGIITEQGIHRGRLPRRYPEHSLRVTQKVFRTYG